MFDFRNNILHLYFLFAAAAALFLPITYIFEGIQGYVWQTLSQRPLGLQRLLVECIKFLHPSPRQLFMHGVASKRQFLTAIRFFATVCYDKRDDPQADGDGWGASSGRRVAAVAGPARRVFMPKGPGPRP